MDTGTLFRLGARYCTKHSRSLPFVEFTFPVEVGHKKIKWKAAC